MKAYAIVQAFAIASIVAWSAWYAARRLLPTVSRRAQAGVASWFERPGHAAWLRRLGHSMQPVQASSGGCGTSGCSTCGACAPAAAVEAQPLVFKPRTKS
ncbi:MAG TPA: DUF6587 family protein [Rhodanobacteraceae bacterium]|jgi:hypothetical protein|nr:DUF6587 family protein [Rhodanobacteraceae bacterium]